MQRNLSGVLFAAILAAQPGTGLAESGIVVELYTSQGCSSCPPADDMFGKLVDQPGLIPLALHVDYWDYIGWADTFASPKFSERQYAYAHAMDKTMVYTPQIIVQGNFVMMGHGNEDLDQAITMAKALPKTVDLQASRNGNEIVLRLEAQAAGPAIVQLVRYAPKGVVKIESGENAGHQLTYVNIVTKWDRIGEWDGRSVLETSYPISGDEPAVVIVQSIGPRAILAAYRLD